MEKTHTISFWGRVKVNRGVSVPLAEEIGQVLPQLIGVVDLELNLSGTWLITEHAGTDQKVMTRIPEHVERITVDVDSPVRAVAS